MVKIIADNGTVITIAKVADLTANQLKEIFKDDPQTDVLLTYVVTKQPFSRRVKPEPKG